MKREVIEQKHTESKPKENLQQLPKPLVQSHPIPVHLDQFATKELDIAVQDSSSEAPFNITQKVSGNWLQNLNISKTINKHYTKTPPNKSPIIESAGSILNAKPIIADTHQTSNNILQKTPNSVISLDS